MDFLEVLRKRFSCRKFKKDAVPKKLIEEILDLTSLAPSAGNAQCYRIIIIEDPKIKERLADVAFSQRFISEAPLVAVFFADQKCGYREYGKRGEELYSFQDATIAAAYFQLILTNFGLSSCWVGAFDERGVLDLLSPGTPLKPIAIIPFGFPKELPKDKERAKRWIFLK